VENILLSYSPEDSFEFGLYINVWQGSSCKAWTQTLIDFALSLQGTYYLPYHAYATKVQFHQAYPGAQEFVKWKKKLDPHTRLRSGFYTTYFG